VGEQERGQHGALFRAVQRDRDAIAYYLDRAEDTELQTSRVNL
jgi:hypothetical protein